jgi:hypothetical protein
MFLRSNKRIKDGKEHRYYTNGGEPASAIRENGAAVLLLDGDSAGRSAGARIAERLVSKVSTRVVEIPVGVQPDLLGADQIRCLCIPGYF